MLPATFQTPAAIILLLGALLACSFMGTEQTLPMIVAWIGGGIAGALILLVAYFAGVALLGAGIGAGAAHMIWAAFKAEPALLVLILFSIAGALAALAL